MSKVKENSIVLEALLTVFTVEKGKLKVLLERKKEDPYKGYWVLPNKIVEECSLDNTVDRIVNDQIGVDMSYLEQNYTFSDVDRVFDERVVSTSYIGLIDSKSYEIKKNKIKDIEKDWFSIDEIPKMAYDHKKIIEKSILKLKNILVNTSVLKLLFPSDFTLPELQSVYETVMDVKLDRRNFRKKFISFGLIEDTGYNSAGFSGRPAKLYRFKEDIRNINLF